MRPKYVDYDGLSFCLENGSCYYRYNGAKEVKERRLHRYVWSNQVGPIPEGLHVHHRFKNDEHTTDASRLSLITPSAHATLHGLERADWARENIVKNAVPAARAWHRSEEGRAWHSETSKRAMAARKARPSRVTCEECSREYKTIFPSRSRFCHQNCKMRARTRRLKGERPLISMADFL